MAEDVALPDMKVDNTTRENKNATVLSYVAWLVASLGFRVGAVMTSRVGHTHNRLGQQW